MTPAADEKVKVPPALDQRREAPTAINQPPNPRRALVVGAADAACWVMQRTLVELLVKKGLMSKRTLGEEVRANYVAEREKIGEEAAAHLRIWMQELGCTDIPDSE
jgi:hypothetical protein